MGKYPICIIDKFVIYSVFLFSSKLSHHYAQPNTMLLSARQIDAIAIAIQMEPSKSTYSLAIIATSNCLGLS